MIKAVIFDLDNTLYDYDRCNAIAEKKLCEAISQEFSISTEEVKESIKIAKVNVKQKLGKDVAASHNRLLYMQDICEQHDKNPLRHAMKFYNVYWEMMLQEMELFDYVIPTVDGLKRKGIKRGLLTDLTAYIQYRKISSLGLNDKMDCLVTSEEAGIEKPSPKMFDLMLRKLDVLPQEALMIGDSQTKDIEGAMMSGIQALKYEKGMDVYGQISALLRF